MILWKWRGDCVGDGARRRRRGRAPSSPAEGSGREKRVIEAMGGGVMRYSSRWRPAARRGDSEDADPARTSR